jgi:hypothetical protein
MAAVMVSPDRASAERRFFTGMALAILATVIVGFSRSFFLRPLFPELPSPSEMIFYVHGVVFTAWIVLLVVQASLVAGGRTELHRKIGPFSAVLAVAMVVLGTLGALIAASHAMWRLAHHRFAAAAARRVGYSGLARFRAVGDRVTRLIASSTQRTS